MTSDRRDLDDRHDRWRDALALAALGVLDEEGPDRRALADHLAGCAACRSDGAALAAATAALALALPLPSPLPSPPKPGK